MTPATIYHATSDARVMKRLERELAKIGVRVFVRVSILTLLVFALGMSVWAVTGGSISGTLRDPSGAVVPDASVTLQNIDLATTYHATTDAQGFYSFPSVPVGRYQLIVDASGFKSQEKTGLQVDTDSAIR